MKYTDKQIAHTNTQLSAAYRKSVEAYELAIKLHGYGSELANLLQDLMPMITNAQVIDLTNATERVIASVEGNPLPMPKTLPAFKQNKDADGE